MADLEPVSPPRPSLLEAKLRIPALPELLVRRPRLERDLGLLVETHRVVRVCATAGAGKTTAVAQGVASLARPVAWFCLDESDVEPGRLILYLEAAIRRALPDLTPVVEAALASGVMHAEAAGLLAQELRFRSPVIVIDELERLASAPVSRAVVSSFVRYASQDVTTILISRRDVELNALTRMDIQEVGELSERSLAFTAPEAAQSLALRGLSAVDAPSVVEATGGWVAGVLFDAWRSHHHVGGDGGEADPLYGYLTAQILDPLSEPECALLIETSVLPEVTAELAGALGIVNPGDVLATLRLRHLPAVWDRDGVLRCHPRFREYLSAELRRLDAPRRRGLHQRYGEMLAQAGQSEEAVDELLKAGDLAAAASAAARALPSVISRLDFDLADRWLAALSATGPIAMPELLLAQLTVAVGRESFSEAVRVADELDRLAVAGPPGYAALAAWSYWHVGNVDGARKCLEQATDRHDRESVAYLLSLMDDGPVSAPQPSGGPLDVLALRISYARGRLWEVGNAPYSGAARAATESIAAARALGDLETTKMMLDLVASGNRLSNLRLEGTVKAELLLDLGRTREAREALTEGQARVARSGSVVFDMVGRLLAIKLELRSSGHWRRALEIAAGLEQLEVMRRYGYIAEQADVWTGYALLLAGRDAEALRRLRSAVESMQRSDRILEMPAAAVYLAEAEERAGHPDRAALAADLALATATRQGSRHSLLQSLADVPTVLSARLDLELSDGPWHDVARALALRQRAPARPVAPRITLRDFGTPAMFADGQPRRARLSKTYLLLAYMIEVARPVSRHELLEVLMEGRDDGSARAYVRQVVHGLRQLLPTDLDLVAEGDFLALSEPDRAESESGVLLARLAGAGRLSGAQRVTALERALEPYERGPWLEGVNTNWALERRSDLERLVTDARVDMAVAAYEDGQLDLAARVLRRVLSGDPFRERAWRLRMRVAASQGHHDELVGIFGACRASLAEVGLEPADATQSLLAGLRR
jgi:DNA-binding SARP family transcriptional activator